MASERTGGRLGDRGERREATVARIKRVARALLVEKGVQAVRLRAVARELGLTAPALYRYVAGHEDLMRLLTEEIYEELTTAVERAAAAATVAERTGTAVSDGSAASSATSSARSGRSATDDQTSGPSGEAPAADPAAPLLAAGRALRTWALEHPREFGLVFVSPVPPPGEPAERTPSRVRLLTTFGRLFTDLWRARPFPVPAETDLPGRVRRTLTPVGHWLLPGLPLGAAYVFVCWWERLYGAVCLEAFGHLSWAFDDGEPLFEQTLAELRDRTSPSVRQADRETPPGPGAGPLRR